MVIDTPAVSIAIRAYRRASLAAAVESVLRQTWTDLELVIYDDAGDLEDVAASFRDDRVRYVRAVTKLEASGRYKAAIALCRGAKYVGVLDDDDRYERRFVECLAGALDQNPRAGAACCREMLETDGVLSESPRRHAPGPQLDLARRILAANWGAAPSTMLLRRAALDDGERRHPMPDGVAPDAFVTFRMTRGGWDVIAVDEILAVRGIHAGRISGTLKGLDYAVATFEQLPAGDRELDDLRRRMMARTLLTRATHHLVARRARDARLDLRNARAACGSAHPFLRHAIGLATWLPLVGPMAARTARAVRRWMAAARPRAANGER